MNYLKIHDLHPYHAKFYAGIPQYFISKYAKKKDVIFDPFCGCGTTLMETNIAGYHSVGVDINFLSAKISSAKVFSAKYQFVRNFTDKILNSVNDTPIQFTDSEFWFTKNNFRELCCIYNAIQKIDDTDYKNIFEVAISSVLNRVCNKRSTWNLGYLSDNILPNLESKLSIKKEFQKKCEWLIAAYKEKEEVANYSSVYCSNIKEFDFNEQFNLIITSPPYPFAVDFARNNRLSYYLFNEDLDAAAQQETGARYKRNKKNCEDSFFAEMQEIYTRLMQLVCFGGYICMTVGDTKRKNRAILFTDWLINFFNEQNWIIVEDNMRQLQRQSMGQKRIPEEHVLVLQKCA
ncbi:MAG: site-specific DNA-methyltransferase [Prevotellaceae bacterium]|jgi:hypothetical protein|nr:site-specific DNA-methyltransferase [Prevotellaceae bacterium]